MNAEITIVGIDGGLATCGIAVIRTDGTTTRCTRADVFINPPMSNKLDIELADDRVRRTRALSRWLDAHLTEAAPHVVAVEAMSFPRSHHAVVAISLGWGVIADQLELRQLPLVTAQPNVWRKELAPSGKERLAHRAALKICPSFADRARAIPRRNQVHGYDALGVACWSLGTNMIRAMLMARSD